MRRQLFALVPAAFVALLAARHSRDDASPIVLHAESQLRDDVDARVTYLAPIDATSAAPPASSLDTPAPPAPALAHAAAPAPTPATAPAPTPAAASIDAPPSGDVEEGIEAVANVDYPRAAASFRRACDHGSAFACGALGKLLATGTGLKRDLPEGRALLRRGCTADEPWVCGHLHAVEEPDRAAN